MTRPSGDPGAAGGTPAALAVRSDVQSIDRAMAILGVFTQQRPVVGVTEIARRTGLTRGTAHRLLMSLLAHQLVRQVQPGPRYALGPRVLELAHVADKSLDLRHVAHDLLARLRDQCAETVGLHVFQPPRHRVTIDQAESRHSLRRTYTDLQRPIPVHQGAPGKALLAHLPGHVTDAVLAAELEPATGRTITRPDRLRDELEEIRRRGWSLSLQERVDGVSALGVPVFDARGAVAAAISVTGPASRCTGARLGEIAPLAVATAREISARLGA